MRKHLNLKLKPYNGNSLQKTILGNSDIWWCKIKPRIWPCCKQDFTLLLQTRGLVSYASVQITHQKWKQLLFHARSKPFETFARLAAMENGYTEYKLNFDMFWWTGGAGWWACALDASPRPWSGVRACAQGLPEGRAEHRERMVVVEGEPRGEGAVRVEQKPLRSGGCGQDRCTDR